MCRALGTMDDENKVLFTQMTSIIQSKLIYHTHGKNNILRFISIIYHIFFYHFIHLKIHVQVKRQKTSYGGLEGHGVTNHLSTCFLWYRIEKHMAEVNSSLKYKPITLNLITVHVQGHQSPHTGSLGPKISPISNDNKWCIFLILC